MPLADPLMSLTDLFFDPIVDTILLVIIIPKVPVMNRVLFVLIAISAFCFSTNSLHAQSLSGRITDSETGEGIPFATLVLSDSAGSFVEGTSSTQKGNYSLPVKPGKYWVKVDFIGYESFAQELSIKGARKLDISMKVQTLLMDQVNIEGQKTTIEQLIDKKVINVGNDLLAAGGDAVTVLDQLAEVQTDQNGNISLRGSSNVNVLVNGKPSPLSSAELLRQISSSDIESIEIITSPSAKYQANGLTGIINIITKQKVKKGLNGTVNAGGNTLKGGNLGTTLSYGSNRFNYKLGASYRHNIFRHENYRVRSGIGPFEQWNSFLFDGEVAGIRGSIDWFVNEHNEFTLGVNYTDNRHAINNEGNVIQRNETVFQSSLGNHVHKTLNLNANYRHYFSSKDHFLEIDAQASDNSNVLSADFKPNLAIRDNLADNDVSISNIAVDYSKKLGKSAKFESGYLWNKQQLNNNRMFFNGSNEIDQEESFTNRRSTHALYALSSFTIQKLSIKAGIRAEVFERSVAFSSSELQIKNDYADLFPSVHLSYEINKALVLVAGYNRRTSRPSMYQVNPITFQSNEFTVTQGNPDLNPEFSHNFDLSVSIKNEKFRISPTFSYRQKEDLIIQNNNINAEGVTIYSFFNNGKSDVYGVGVDLSANPVKWLSSTLGFNWNYEEFRNDQIGFTRNFMRRYSLLLRNQVSLTKKLGLTFSWRYNSPQSSFYFTRAYYQKWDLGLRYSLLKSKGTLGLRVTDVFNTQVREGLNTGDGFQQFFITNPISRVAYLTFSYNFGKNDLKKRGKKARQYESGIID